MFLRRKKYHGKLFIVRGLPGSGKTTWALERSLTIPGSVIAEADQFFTNPETNEYNYNPELLKTAHAWCYKKVERNLRDNRTVFVANTFTRLWEFEKYIKLAKDLGIEFEVISCISEFQNTHGVPDEVVKKMKDRWEEYEDEGWAVPSNH